MTTWCVMKHSPQLGTLQAKVTPSKETSDSKQLGEWRMNKYLHFIGCYFLPIGLTILLAFLLQDYFSRIQIHAKSRNNKMAGAPEIVVLPSDVEIKERICEAVITIAEKSIKDHGFFSVGFSGGSLAKFLAQGLKDRAGIDWPNWHIFFCDERHVPFDSEDSTYGYFKTNLFSHVNVKEENIYAINFQVSVDAAAEDYVSKIRKLYPGDGVPQFDLLLLGMGPDGHTCSLFPGHPGLEENSKLIISITDSPKPPPCRITMTYPVLNNAANVMVVTAGGSKAEAVKKCLKPENGEPLPAGRVKPSKGKLTWYLDEAAAKLIG